MNPKVRSTLADDFALDQACSICGEKRLQVVHLDAYPDYVNCENCGSAFVVEDGGERVMYGKIPAKYPDTRHFALQQWVWPEAIARKAAPERTSVPASPPEPPPLPEAEEPAASPEAEMEPETEASDDEGPPETSLEALMAEEAQPAEPLDADQFAAEPKPADLPPEGTLEPEEPESPAWPPPPPHPTEAAPENLEEAAADVFGAADEPDMGEEAALESESPAFDWKTPAGEQPPGEAEPPSTEDESAFDEEDDLLDSLWGEEASAAEAAEPEGLPEAPSWVNDFQPEDEAQGPSEEEATPTETEAELPQEPDEDTAGRLHTWGAPQPDEVESPEAADEAPDEAAEEAPEEVPEEPPMVAPFEAGDWASESYGLPEEPAPEPTMEAPPPPSTETVTPEDTPTPATEDEAPPMAPSEETPEPASEDAEMAGMAQAYWGGEKGPPPPKEEMTEEEATKAEAEHHEPPPGNRYRVVVNGASVRYPENICAHCEYSPAPARLPVLASIARSGVGDRHVETLRIPVCEDCKGRASARSEEQRTAQLQAHLIGVLVALVLIVCGLGIGFINLRENLAPALVGLVVMAGLGYVVPAVPLLLRASRLPKPPDSDYVMSTLRVPGDTEGAETAFEWRNQNYARRFLQANTKIAVSEVTRVREEAES